MKKLIPVVLVLIICLSMMAAKPYESKKDQAHEIAELAREMGLPESDPIIVRAKELWLEADEDFQEDVEILTTVIYNEAGYGCTARHMELVAMVPVNRMNSGKFPDNLYDVVVAPRQYLPAYATPGSYYWNEAREDPIAYNLCREIAVRALNGEIDCPSNVLYQANFPQGTGTFETCKTTYSTSYFCYG